MLLDIEGTQVDFPYDAYECQVRFMEKVVEALKKGQSAALESPTGTGKTLCLLCGAIAYVKDVKSKLTVNVAGEVQGVSSGSLFPKILYASRTHSQLAQVTRELNKTIYKDIKTVTLASRDVLCINETVAKEENNLTKALMCRNLVKSRRCRFYNEYEKHDSAALDSLYSESGLVPDLEDVLTISKRHRLCPFYRTRSALETADLILLPYNYVIDPRLRHAHNVEVKGNIIIFDEAHNLESVCEESVSVSLSSTDISGAIRETKTILEALINDEEEIRTKKDDCGLPFREEEDEKKVLVEKNDVAHLLSMLQSFETVVDEFKKVGKGGHVLNRCEGKVFAGKKIIELLEKAEIRRDIREEISLLIDRIGQYLAQRATEEQGSLWAEKGVRLQKFSSFIATVYADIYDPVAMLTENNSRSRDIANNSLVSNESAENFQLFVTDEEGTINLNYWCFTPAVAMRYLYMRGVRSVIVTSGTLSPIDEFVDGLGVEMKIRLQNEHAASGDQILTACVKADLYGNTICGTFNNRTNDLYLLSVGRVIERVCSLVPQGVLVFFSSYKLMNICIRKWQRGYGAQPPLWDAISRAKKTFVEPKSKTDLRLALIQFRESVREASGGVFFAVCRAKVSEGIDFSDCESRAVVVVGIPYAPTVNPRVELKRQFLTNLAKQKDKKSNAKGKTMSPEQWYQIDAIRAVNQAIGRVLRHKNDFGVVVLADIRFASVNRKHFPLWLRSSVKNFDKISDFELPCIEFFKKHGLKAEGPNACRSAVSLKSESNLKKRKAMLRTGSEGVQENPRWLSGIDDLYPASEAQLVKRTRSEATPNNRFESITEPGSTLALIDEMNAAGSSLSDSTVDRFQSQMTTKESNEVVCHSTQRKKIKLKPNSTSVDSPVQNLNMQLEALRKTPAQFTAMVELRETDSSCRDKVKGALTSYSTSKDLDAFVTALTAAALPNNREIFTGVYGFVNDVHKEAFAAACRRLKLV